MLGDCFYFSSLCEIAKGRLSSKRCLQPKILPLGYQTLPFLKPLDSILLYNLFFFFKSVLLFLTGFNEVIHQITIFFNKHAKKAL